MAVIGSQMVETAYPSRTPRFRRIWRRHHACLDHHPRTVQAMKAGATEFLTMPLREEELLGAIRFALERSRETLEREAQINALRYASLSPREKEVMTLVASGLLNKPVGTRLGISEFTVKMHRGRVMRKMKAVTLADLVNRVSSLRLMLAAKVECQRTRTAELSAPRMPAATERVSESRL
jgi:DNA-binding CsgD family transcriptional regulator